jgi:RNA polymerase sigma-70 factor (ECF subfamily)
LARALGALPEPFRRAIELVDLADLSYRDAAATLGVPLGTVMSRLHRGRRMLAEALRPNEEGGVVELSDSDRGLPEAA